MKTICTKTGSTFSVTFTEMDGHQCLDLMDSLLAAQMLTPLATPFIKGAVQSWEDQGIAPRDINPSEPREEN